MEYRDGQFYYAPLRRKWGVWQHHKCGDNFAYGTFIKDFPTKEEAREEVYKLNGWFK